jgi:predicted ATPase
LALLAEASAKLGQPEAGLALLAEALAVLNDTEERRWEAKLYRLKGELLLARSAGHDTEAETCFRQALDVARQQQAKSWELRAATSLSRLWQRQGIWRDAVRSTSSRGMRSTRHQTLAPGKPLDNLTLLGAY